MSVADYFGKLEKLWDELAASDMVIFIHNFWYKILLAPSLDWTFKAMNKEEQLQKLDHQVKPATKEVMTFSVNASIKGTPEYKSRFIPNVTCTYWNRIGHEESTCFGKHGFPEWWGDRPQTCGRPDRGQGADRGRGSAARPRTAEARAITCSVVTGSGQASTIYYVPQFCCNLLSITHLCDDTDCVVSFVKSNCLIQDRFSRMLIGLGERRGGLYYLRGGIEKQANRAVETQDPIVWHRRLGHTSASIVNSLPFVFCPKNSLDKPCDICYQAKQTHESFSLSDNIACSPFDLVHCDLWGPYRIPSSIGARFFLTIVDDFPRVAEGMETDEHRQATTEAPLGRGKRTRVPSVRLRDFVVNTLSIPRPPHTPASSSSQLPSGNGNLYSLSDVVDSSRFSLDHRIFLTVVTRVVN
ncbi:hypothetical protein LIER_17608 [Lithospermum erythrorhizon]|uniref:GAG-pre-integrase domain-containing protein n=1 Tax=Lithospermum erythrorhizon TaxID=34254 RepID=A0AAV3QDH9_LITER